MVAFAGAGVAPPHDGEANVLVFDGVPWFALIAAAAGWLGADERQRAGRFRFARDYATDVLAHAIWRLGRELESQRKPGGDRGGVCRHAGR